MKLDFVLYFGFKWVSFTLSIYLAHTDCCSGTRLREASNLIRQMLAPWVLGIQAMWAGAVPKPSQCLGLFFLETRRKKALNCKVWKSHGRARFFTAVKEGAFDFTVVAVIHVCTFGKNMAHWLQNQETLSWDGVLLWSSNQSTAAALKSLWLPKGALRRCDVYCLKGWTALAEPWHPPQAVIPQLFCFRNDTGYRVLTG